MEAEAQARAMVAAKEKELGERKKKHVSPLPFLSLFSPAEFLFP